ncbi:hypothetical protein OROHE_012381 [Orobanche hederae]
MEFWGAEVKPGQKLKCRPEIGKLIHISQYNEAFSDFDDEDENAELPLEPQVNGTAKAVKENKDLMIEHNGSKKEVHHLDDDSEEDEDDDDDNAFLGEERAIGDSDGSDDEGEDESSEDEEVELELISAKQSSKKRGVAGSAEKTSEAKRAKSSALKKGKDVLNSTPTPTPTLAPSKSAGPFSSKSADKKQQTPKSHKSKVKHGGKHIGK